MHKLTEQANLIIGKTFGKLTVLKRVPNKCGDRDTVWLCECVCGNKKEVRRSVFRNIEKCSCGCHRDGLMNPNFKGYELIGSNFWNTIKRGANERGLEFLITIEQAWSLYVNQNKLCALSGEPINLSIGSINRTASLDRIDSNKGYTLDNIQWIHKDLNRMKIDFDQNYFLQTLIEININYEKRSNK